MTRVLLVDDEEDWLLMTKKFLSKEDSSLKLASITSAKEAKNILDREHFDVVVSDYQMPGMDGIELLEQIRSENNDIPFIIFTGKGREEIAIKALNLGADYYIRKGGDPKSQYVELVHVIHRVVRHKTAEKELVQAEKALGEKEERFQRILESIPDPIYLWEQQSDGRIILTHVNKAAIESTKGKVTDGIGIELENAPINEPDLVLALKHTMNTGEIKRLERLRKLRTTGEQQWHLIDFVQPARDCVLVITRDITKRKQMEEALRESERSFRRTFEAIPDPTYLWEEQVDGQIILKHANKAAIEITKGKIIADFGSELEDLHSKEPEFIFTIKQILETGEKKRNEEHIIMRTTGEEKWFLTDFVKAAENRIMVITKDFTEWKQIEALVRQHGFTLDGVSKV